MLATGLWTGPRQAVGVMDDEDVKVADKEAIVPMIAKAIKDADKKYFNEDYTAQALAVISTLRRAGLAIVPVTPSDDMVDFAKESLTYGRQKPQDMLKNVYISMVRRASGLER